MSDPAEKSNPNNNLHHDNLNVVQDDEMAMADLQRLAVKKSLVKNRVHAEENEQWLVSYADMMTLLVGFFVMLQSFSKVDDKLFEQIKKETTMVFGGEYKIPFEKLQDSLKAAIAKQGLADQVAIEKVENGIVLNFRGALFFDSGSTQLKDSGAKLMKEIIPVVAKEADGFGIIVEGHTDNVPISGGVYPSNWELSSVRACTVLRLFESSGFDRNRLKAIGWGDSKPLIKNEDNRGIASVENQAQNRRVVIKVLKNMDF